MANRQNHAASISMLADKKPEMKMKIRKTRNSIGCDMLSGHGVRCNIRLKDYVRKRRLVLLRHYHRLTARTVSVAAVVTGTSLYKLFLII